MPNVERFCTYRQCLDYVRRHCTFFSAAEMDAVLGGTMAELFALKRDDFSSNRHPALGHI
jgi:hypothetical protein